jgi:hypothetical protein
MQMQYTKSMRLHLLLVAGTSCSQGYLNILCGWQHEGAFPDKQA